MKADVYAFRMLLFRLACPELSLPLESGRQVTFNSEIAEMRREISAGLAFERPENVDKDYWDLVCACLKENPVERPQFSQICTVIQHLPKFKTPSRDKCRYLERITELSSHFDSSFNAPSVSHEEVLLFENPVYKDAIAKLSREIIAARSAVTETKRTFCEVRFNCRYCTVPYGLVFDRNAMTWKAYQTGARTGHENAKGKALNYYY